MHIFNLKTWVHYYVSLLKKLGAFRFSLILAIAIISADSVLQVFLAYYFDQPLGIADVYRSFILGGLITPWSVYFLTVVVGDLEQARENLDHTVEKLQVTVKNDQQKAIALESEIIERQKSELVVEQAAILMRSFLDTSPDPFFHRDLDGRFVSCNKAMSLLLGKEEKELVGLNAFDVYPEPYANDVIRYDQKAKDTQQEQLHENWLHYPNGRKAYFEIKVLPLYNAKKECVGVIGFARDTTEHKKNEEVLEKASRDKTTFISTISHELRTPLNGIVGLSRMLLDEPLSDTQIKHLKTIHISAITLGNIFNDIVDLDKLDRHHLNLVDDNVNVLDFIDGLKSLAHIQTEQKGLTLRFEQVGQLPAYINVDGTRLRQVLWNLISNAVKFTEQGLVTIRCLCEAQSSSLVRLTFEVEDQGIGIPADQLDKIFAMYYQVKGNNHATGTGIGLAVSSQIVEAMSGELTVKSELTQGSCFTLSLPVSCSQEKNKASDLLPSSLSLSILLVEDIDLNILVATALLEKLGHRVDSAKSGQEALSKMASNQYQLILMDIQLPDMNGYEVTKRLKHLYTNNVPPIVALTANVFTDKQSFIENGMDDALGKPLGVNALNEVIKRLFIDKNSEPEVSTLLADKAVNLLLNEQMLSELLEFISADAMIDNIALFEKMMPDYIQILDSNMIAKDKDGIVNEAHKIKGAAAAIGLKRIQALSEKVQSPDLPAWWDNIDDWVELIKSHYKDDIIELKQWIITQAS